jgi:hypothetical protein
MKTLSFSIRPFSEVIKDFASAFEAVRRCRRIPKGPRAKSLLPALRPRAIFSPVSRLNIGACSGAKAVLGASRGDAPCSERRPRPGEDGTVFRQILKNFAESSRKRGWNFS